MNVDVHALAGAYALDAVDDVERAGFDRHLADCDTCRLEVAELRETAAQLAPDAPTASVPPQLRQRVLDEVARTPQQRTGGVLTGLPRRRSLRWRTAVAAAVAAGVVAVGGSAATWAVMDSRLERERAASARARQVADVLAASDARVYTGSVGGAGAVTLVVSPERDRGVVVLRDLPAAGEGRAYQLWLIRGEVARPVGLLPARATAATMLVGPVDDAATFGVSNEPAAGSPAPTRVVALLPLS
jgi:anti-sigma-K factor RskA